MSYRPVATATGIPAPRSGSALPGGVALVFCCLLLSACAGGPDLPQVTERYVTANEPALNIDSVASWNRGDSAWLFATSKDGHFVRLFDPATGTTIRDLGGPGSGVGEMQRPNGIVAVDDLLVVVERDNHRVQIFSLPALEPLALFGSDELIKHYGAWLMPDGADRYRLYVSDAYETADERVPAPEALDRRIHVFTLDLERDAGGRLSGVGTTHSAAFGATAGPGVLRVVESLWGDPNYDRLLIAEEDPAGGRVIKVYSLDGRYTGPLIGDGIFRAQPEGIALYACPDGSGWWLTTDQDRRRNVFQLFDRRTLAHVGGFTGAVTDNTDGIWLSQTPLPGFPAGAFFAVHDDQAVAAFDWRDIAAALGLPAGCP